ncbi:MAG TPA: ABC transporter substrate-binding protein [Thermomicrobiales bacterium]|nr:ABC transporter substrate-binding protein [Thermomicrobiales bacterium]
MTIAARQNRIRPASIALSRRAFASGALALGLVSTPVIARARQDAGATPTPGGVLRVGVQGDPTELDPARSNLAATELVVDLVYEGLVHEGPDLVPQPGLAESWQLSDDGLTYTFSLRQGVTFHNGREVTSDDVVYSIERVMDPETGSPYVSYTERIAGIEAQDAATVVITLDSPDASFLAGLGRRGLVIVPREVVEEVGLSQQMVGTGPFRFVDYVPNTSITLERNEAYWDTGKPYLDGVELQIIPDDTARTTALVSGTVDLIEQVPHKDIEIIEQTDGVDLTGGATTNLRWLVFNTRREPFDRPEVRQAIARGIDRQPIIDAAVFGYGEPLVGMYPETFWFGYRGGIPAPDPEGAASELADLGLPTDFQPGLLTWAQYGFLSATSVVVQEQLRQLGIESEIESEENATYIQRFYEFDFDIAVMGASGYVDPNDFIQQNFRSDSTNNTSGYANPEMDALIAEGLETQDLDARAEIYQQIQQLIIDDAPWVNLYTSSTFEGSSDRVRGFEHYLSGSLHALRATWLEG